MTTAVVAGRRIRITGIVQGVGFRPCVYRAAPREQVPGRVRNEASGVTIDAFGSAEALARFVAALRSPPPAASVLTMTIVDIEPETTSSFDIVASDRGSE